MVFSLKCLKFSYKVFQSQNEEDEAEIFINDKTLFHSSTIERFCAQNSEDLVFQYHFIHSQFARNLFQKRSFRPPAPQWFFVIDSD